MGTPINYTDIDFVNGGAPALNATNLNHIVDKSKAAADRVDAYGLDATCSAKASVADADELLTRDSADGNYVKKVTWTTAFTAIWTKLGALIAGGTDKATPADADTLALSDSAASGATKKLTWANFKATLKTYFDTLYAALAHASRHQHGGADEIATATPGPNVIPKTGADNKLAPGFLPQATSSAIGGALLGANGGAIKDTKMPDGATAVYSQDAWATADGWAKTGDFGAIDITTTPGRARVTRTGVGVASLYKNLGTSAPGKYMVIRYRSNTPYTLYGHETLGSSLLYTLPSTAGVDTTIIVLHKAIYSTTSAWFYIYSASGSVNDYIELDFVLVGDYSYLDGSLSEEAARFANEGGDAPGVGVAAVGTITATDVATATKGDTIGGKKYTFVAALTASPGVEGEVLKGATKEDDLENLNLAISEAGRASNGTKYWAAAVHPLVSSTRSGAILNLTARTPGILGNQITVVCESGTNHTASGSTLSGGLGAGGAKIINMVGNNIAGGGTRPAAAMIERTNTSLIGYEATVKLALGATYTFPAGGTFDWVALAYDANIGGADQGTAAGGSTVTMAGANSKLWIRRRS